MVLDKATAPAQRWTVLLPPRCQVFCSAALQRAPIWTCHRWLFSPHSFSSWTNVLYMPESLNSHGFTSICNVNKNSKLDPENMLGLGWLTTENFILPKGSDAPKKIHFRLYKSTGKRSTIWHTSFSLPVMPDDELTKLEIFKCLTPYCSLRNSYCY